MADKKRGEVMSPRTGRPPIKNPKSDRVTVRLTEYQQRILSECAKKFGTSEADIIRRGINLMEVEKDNEEARQLFDAIELLNEYAQKDSSLIDSQIKQVESNFKWYMESIKK